MTAVLLTCSSLIVCKITRPSALQLVKPQTLRVLEDPDFKEALLLGLEQAYGEADVWLGLTPARAITVFMGLYSSTVSDIQASLLDQAMQSALSEVKAALETSLEKSWRLV